MALLDWLWLALVVLKLCGVINWSWWVVMAPEIVKLLAIAVVEFNKELERQKWRPRR